MQSKISLFSISRSQNKIIFTMDITSLHTVIPNNEGLQALKYFFNRLAINKPSSETLLRLGKLVLTRDYFSFGDSHYKQINGVAMGTKMGPGYTNLFVGFISNYRGPKPDLHKLYIDNCVGATLSSREHLNQFNNSVNSFNPALKYTWEISENSLAFLDLKLSINENDLSASVQYKPTDSHNYLLHSSSHPQQVYVKNAIPISQFHRLRRLCSDDTDFNWQQMRGSVPVFRKMRLPWLCSNHRQLSRPRNRPRDRTTNFTERRNRQNHIHPYPPSTKPCESKLQNSP